MSACAAGPATTNGWPLDTSGYPKALMSSISSAGTSSFYKIDAPIAHSSRGQNIFTANFYDWTGGLVTKPAAYATTDLSGYSIPSVNAAYAYLCLDEAAEVKQRIRVYINSWDTDAAFASYVSSGVGSPFTAGNDGVACDVGGSVPGASPCHDYSTWDSLTGYPQDP
jgi:hypothetical protein